THLTIVAEHLCDQRLNLDRDISSEILNRHWVALAREMTRYQVIGNHTERVKIDSRMREATTFPRQTRDILLRPPPNWIAIANATRSFEIYRTQLPSCREDEIGRFAISPDPTCRVYPFQYGRNLTNKIKGLSQWKASLPTLEKLLQSLSVDVFDRKIIMIVCFKAGQHLRNSDPVLGQAHQSFSFPSYSPAAITAIKRCLAKPPALFKNTYAWHGLDKMNRQVDATLSSLIQGTNDTEVRF